MPTKTHKENHLTSITTHVTALKSPQHTVDKLKVICSSRPSKECRTNMSPTYTRPILTPSLPRH